MRTQDCTEIESLYNDPSAVKVRIVKQIDYPIVETKNCQWISNVDAFYCSSANGDPQNKVEIEINQQQRVPRQACQDWLDGKAVTLIREPKNGGRKLIAPNIYARDYPTTWLRSPIGLRAENQCINPESL